MNKRLKLPARRDTTRDQQYADLLAQVDALAGVVQELVGLVSPDRVERIKNKMPVTHAHLEDTVES